LSLKEDTQKRGLNLENIASNGRMIKRINLR